MIRSISAPWVRELISGKNRAYLYGLLGESTLAFTLLINILVARILGLGAYDVFASAVALTGILSLLIQVGFPMLHARDVSAQPASAIRATTRYLFVQGLVTLSLLGVVYPLSALLGYDDRGVLVCVLLLFAEAGRSMKLVLRAVLKGMGHFGVEAVAVAIERAAALLITVAVLVTTRDLVWTVVAMTLTRLTDVLGFFGYLRRRFGLHEAVTRERLLASIRAAAPFALGGLLWILYYQVDIVMLRAMAPEGQAGTYSAAYRLMEVILALPRVLCVVASTRFARQYAQQPEHLEWRIHRFAALLTAAILPVLVVAALAQGFVVEGVFGKEYAAATVALGVLLPALAVNSYGVVAREALKAMHEERRLPGLLGGALGVNIVCNLVLIPILGSLGAAIATLAAEITLAASSVVALRRAGGGGVHRTLLKFAVLTAGATAAGSWVAHGLAPATGLGIVMLFGVVAAWAVLRALRLSELPADIRGEESRMEKCDD